MTDKEKKTLELLEFIFEDLDLNKEMEREKVDYPAFKLLNDIFWGYPLIRFENGREAIVLEERDPESGGRPLLLMDDGYEATLDIDDDDIEYTIEKRKPLN